jgi:hypothetical protein
LSDPNKIGIRDIIDRVKLRNSTGVMTPAELVRNCLDVLGPLDVLDSTLNGLTNYAGKFDDLNWDTEASAAKFDEAAVAVIQLVVSSQEYQTV